MAVKVTKHREHMEDHGEDVRIERYARCETTQQLVSHTDQETGKTSSRVEDVNLLDEQGRPVYKWAVYRRTPTGAKIENGQVVAKGKHPVIKNDRGEPIDTIDTHIWVPVFRGDEDAARAKVRELTETPAPKR
jgi:hypothetical protein